MAKYKVLLTVKDRYGTKKELSGGILDIGIDSLSVDDSAVLDAHFATDAEVTAAIKANNEIIHYAGFELENDENN